jgi:hypothetical protein
MCIVVFYLSLYFELARETGEGVNQTHGTLNTKGISGPIDEPKQSVSKSD